MNSRIQCECSEVGIGSNLAAAKRQRPAKFLIVEVGSTVV
jgi:hypothetical protein